MNNLPSFGIGNSREPQLSVGGVGFLRNNSQRDNIPTAVQALWDNIFSPSFNLSEFIQVVTGNENHPLSTRIKVIELLYRGIKDNTNNIRNTYGALLYFFRPELIGSVQKALEDAKARRDMLQKKVDQRNKNLSSNPEYKKALQVVHEFTDEEVAGMSPNSPLLIERNRCIEILNRYRADDKPLEQSQREIKYSEDLIKNIQAQTGWLNSLSAADKNKLTQVTNVFIENHPEAVDVTPNSLTTLPSFYHLLFCLMLETVTLVRTLKESYATQYSQVAVKEKYKELVKNIELDKLWTIPSENAIETPERYDFTDCWPKPEHVSLEKMTKSENQGDLLRFFEDLEKKQYSVTSTGIPENGVMISTPANSSDHTPFSQSVRKTGDAFFDAVAKAQKQNQTGQGLLTSITTGKDGEVLSEITLLVNYLKNPNNDITADDIAELEWHLRQAIFIVGEDGCLLNNENAGRFKDQDPILISKNADGSYEPLLQDEDNNTEIKKQALARLLTVDPQRFSQRPTMVTSPVTPVARRRVDSHDVQPTMADTSSIERILLSPAPRTPGRDSSYSMFSPGPLSTKKAKRTAINSIFPLPAYLVKSFMKHLGDALAEDVKHMSKTDKGEAMLRAAKWLRASNISAELTSLKDIYAIQIGDKNLVGVLNTQRGGKKPNTFTRTLMAALLAFIKENPASLTRRYVALKHLIEIGLFSNETDQDIAKKHLNNVADAMKEFRDAIKVLHPIPTAILSPEAIFIKIRALMQLSETYSDVDALVRLFIVAYLDKLPKNAFTIPQDIRSWLDVESNKKDDFIKTVAQQIVAKNAEVREHGIGALMIALLEITGLQRARNPEDVFQIFKNSSPYNQGEHKEKIILGLLHISQCAGKYFEKSTLAPQKKEDKKEKLAAIAEMIVSIPNTEEINITTDTTSIQPTSNNPNPRLRLVENLALTWQAIFLWGTTGENLVNLATLAIVNTNNSDEVSDWKVRLLRIEDEDFDAAQVNGSLLFAMTHGLENFKKDMQFFLGSSLIKRIKRYEAILDFAETLLQHLETEQIQPKAYRKQQMMSLCKIVKDCVNYLKTEILLQEEKVVNNNASLLASIDALKNRAQDFETQFDRIIYSYHNDSIRGIREYCYGIDITNPNAPGFETCFNKKIASEKDEHHYFSNVIFTLDHHPINAQTRLTVEKLCTRIVMHYDKLMTLADAWARLGNGVYGNTEALEALFRAYQGKSTPKLETALRIARFGLIHDSFATDRLKFAKHVFYTFAKLTKRLDVVTMAKRSDLNDLRVALNLIQEGGHFITETERTALGKLKPLADYLRIQNEEDPLSEAYTGFARQAEDQKIVQTVYPPAGSTREEEYKPNTLMSIEFISIEQFVLDRAQDIRRQQTNVAVLSSALNTDSGESSSSISTAVTPQKLVFNQLINILLDGAFPKNDAEGKPYRYFKRGEKNKNFDTKLSRQSLGKMLWETVIELKGDEKINSVILINAINAMSASLQRFKSHGAGGSQFAQTHGFTTAEELIPEYTTENVTGHDKQIQKPRERMPSIRGYDKLFEGKTLARLKVGEKELNIADQFQELLEQEPAALVVSSDEENQTRDTTVDTSQTVISDEDRESYEAAKNNAVLVAVALLRSRNATVESMQKAVGDVLPANSLTQEIINNYEKRLFSLGEEEKFARRIKLIRAGRVSDCILDVLDDLDENDTIKTNVLSRQSSDDVSNESDIINASHDSNNHTDDSRISTREIVFSHEKGNNLQEIYRFVEKLHGRTQANHPKYDARYQEDLNEFLWAAAEAAVDKNDQPNNDDNPESLLAVLKILAFDWDYLLGLGLMQCASLRDKGITLESLLLKTLIQLSQPLWDFANNNFSFSELIKPSENEDDDDEVGELVETSRMAQDAVEKLLKLSSQIQKDSSYTDSMIYRQIYNLLQRSLRMMEASVSSAEHDNPWMKSTIVKAQQLLTMLHQLLCNDEAFIAWHQRMLSLGDEKLSFIHVLQLVGGKGHPSALRQQSLLDPNRKNNEVIIEEIKNQPYFWDQAYTKPYYQGKMANDYRLDQCINQAGYEAYMAFVLHRLIQQPTLQPEEIEIETRKETFTQYETSLEYQAVIWMAAWDWYTQKTHSPAINALRLVANSRIVSDLSEKKRQIAIENAIPTLIESLLEKACISMSELMNMDPAQQAVYLRNAQDFVLKGKVKFDWLEGAIRNDSAYPLLLVYFQQTLSETYSIHSIEHIEFMLQLIYRCRQSFEAKPEKDHSALPSLTLSQERQLLNKIFDAMYRCIAAGLSIKHHFAAHLEEFSSRLEKLFKNVEFYDLWEDYYHYVSTRRLGDIVSFADPNRYCNDDSSLMHANRLLQSLGDQERSQSSCLIKLSEKGKNNILEYIVKCWQANMDSYIAANPKHSKWDAVKWVYYHKIERALVDYYKLPTSLASKYVMDESCVKLLPKIVQEAIERIQPYIRSLMTGTEHPNPLSDSNSSGMYKKRTGSAFTENKKSSNTLMA